MELLSSPILTHLASAILMFVAGFYAGVFKGRTPQQALQENLGYLTGAVRNRS